MSFFSRRSVVLALGLGLAASTGAWGFQARQDKSRLLELVVADPSATVDVGTLDVTTLPPSHPLRARWEAFRASRGDGWRVVVDRRSAAPLLVEGPGIPWFAGRGNDLKDPASATLEGLESSLRAFAAAHRTLLLADPSEWVLDRDSSGPIHDGLWQVVFDRLVAGIPVDGDRYVFSFVHGNLVAFGASRWTRIDADPAPVLDGIAALERLTAYMGVDKDFEVLDGGERLAFVPLRSEGNGAQGPFRGEIGTGYASALVRRVVVRAAGDPGTWVGLIDAHDGSIRAFFDDNRYAQVRGGVLPETVDGICPTGCEQSGYPMPFANLTTGAGTVTAGSMGIFDCSPGGSTATTSLAGPYVRISDNCGAISQSVTCDNDLDLGVSAGADCSVPPGASAGNTRSSRSGFYHLNRAKEHARAWLPSNTWLTSQVTENVNISSTCNAYWDGTINMYRSGGGCNNTGEIAGVVQHEWGHGMDQNDGGSYDNPSEAYADVVEFLFDRTSCIGRGFFQSGTCSGYGNACLDCTGIRDMDWDRRTNHQPSTPTGFIQNNCGGGGGPCGKEEHCEGYLAGETIWDLAARDLPAMGLDTETAWQLADRLFYQSRAGSGGNAYTCSLPNSDGCSATSWFSKMRTVDDDDGNLANGTPHAAAIFAAFNRHKIACGTASDASNQNTSSCPALAAPSVTASAGSGSVGLAWTAVPGAASYRILRNDMGCGYTSTPIASVAAPTTSYTDAALANGFTTYYRVQAVGSNASCEGAISACTSATPQPFAGTVSFDRSVYACASVLTITVNDGNVGGPTTTVLVRSTTETTPETVILTQIAPGAAKYSGTITATPSPAAADGLLSIGHGDTITVDYVDTDDGQGGVNVPRQTTAAADCLPPVISGVQAVDVTGNSARITWTTDESATSQARYGLTTPPAATTSAAGLTTAHSVRLLGLAECSTYYFGVDSADGVGNAASDDNAGTWYTFATGKNTQPEYLSTDTPVSIPDNNTTGANSTITVPDTKTVLDVDVKVNITHTYDGDLTLYLIAPTGTSITLSNRRGGGADNFTDTIFDDEAATAIASGTPPFTGSFRPDSPLTAADGIIAAGAWKLKVVDSAGVDIGQIESWTLHLTFAAQACGPHAVLASHATVLDACDSGSGGANGMWDAGERVQFSVRVSNDGSQTLTGLAATVTPLTPGVVMQDPAAYFADLAAGATADSLAPHVTALLPTSLTCNAAVEFQVDITSDQGAWSGSFTHAVGRLLPGNGTAMNEAFASGIPAAWTIVDGGSGGGSAATWTTSNPGSRSIAAPLSSPVAMVDSDNAGTGAMQDEQLVTPVLDLSAATSVALEFDQYFYWYSSGQDEVGDVDVRSSATGGVWTNVLRLGGASTSNPDHRSIDITSQAAGAPDVQVRFHYYNGSYEWYWQVDNVRVNFTAPAGCEMTVCSTLPPAGPKPVPDGSFGAPMTAARVDPVGTTIDVDWDVATCASTDHEILFGSLANVASYTVDGGVCALGTTGHATWSAVPGGDLWFVVVGTSGSGTEGSWGKNSAGVERDGATASGQCGNLSRDNSGTCP